MKENMKDNKSYGKHSRIKVILLAAAVLAALLVNMLMIHRIARDQIDQMGRLRVQNIASNFQRYLTEAEGALERAGVSLEKLIESGASEEEIREFLLKQRDAESELSGGLRHTGRAGKIPLPIEYVPRDPHADQRGAGHE